MSRNVKNAPNCVSEMDLVPSSNCQITDLILARFGGQWTAGLIGQVTGDLVVWSGSLVMWLGNDRTPDASGRNRTGPDVRSGPAGKISQRPGPDRNVRPEVPAG